MRVGVDLPYLDDPVEIRDFAQAVEDLGYDHLGFSEHVASTRDSDFPDGFAFDDPWHETFTMLGYLAGVTSRIELNPAMLLLTLRPPVLAAKQAAEIDLLSGERLRLAVSVGWNTKEVEALGVDAGTRARRIEEQVEVMRLLWSDEAVTYDGQLIHLHEVGIHPRPRRVIPIWMGGGGFATEGFPTERTMRRAARLADGFKMMAMSALDPDRMHDTVATLRAYVADTGRDPATFGIETRLVLQETAPDEWPRLIDAARAGGATHLGISNRIAGGGAQAQIDSLRAIADATHELW